MEKSNIPVALITGATSGIGKVAARAIAASEMKVVLFARNESKAQDVKEWITQETGNENIDILIADLASLSQVQQAAEAFLKKYQRLDVLLNNAGLIADTKQITEDGYESTFQINHLSHFLLTNMLKEPLKVAKGRVVNVSSEAHRAAPSPNFKDIDLKKSFRSFKAYAFSKLANIWFTKELARRWKKEGITANCLHPGAIASNFGSNVKGGTRLLFFLARPFMIDNQKGAETSIYLSLSPKVASVTGKYFSKKKMKTPSKLALNDEHAVKFWEASEEMCKTFSATTT